MKVKAVLALLPVILAAPNPLQKRLPSHTPVDVHGLDTGFTVSCGKTKVDGHDIHKAVSWGVNLERADQTLGDNQYPHYYGNNGDTRFKFLDPACHDTSLRREFPVVKGDYFDGSNDQVKKIRAIYVHDKKATYFNNPEATYCGTIYHVSGDFEGCDIRKQ